MRRISESNAKFIICDKATSAASVEARKKVPTVVSIVSMGELEDFEPANNIMDMLQDDGSGQ